MDGQDLLVIFLRYLWPFIVAWNVYLHRQDRNREKALSDYKLYVAQNYMSKTDLENMFEKFERSMDEKLRLYINIK
ncbi:hypothetical protein [Desulfosediminicola sp.]|uniref:hypothetical protein n=1 Tax=Desulfosediminicola sp. TaxID=2886825 RepID=UPI003AF2FCE7